MKRWVLVTAVLTIAVLAAAPPAAHAQAKDTLVVALVSHAPTLDPHMHFERVGILELLKELVPRLSRLAVLGDAEINVSQFHATELVQWESTWESCRNVGNGLVPGTGQSDSQHAHALRKGCGASRWTRPRPAETQGAE